MCWDIYWNINVLIWASWVHPIYCDTCFVLPSASDILRYILSCRTIAIYDLPINLRYIYKRVSPLEATPAAGDVSAPTSCAAFADMMDQVISMYLFWQWDYGLYYAGSSSPNWGKQKLWSDESHCISSGAVNSIWSLILWWWSKLLKIIIVKKVTVLF